MISKIKKKQQIEKPLGVYLVEAGIVTQAQVDMALDEQKISKKRLGEILANRGWIEQQTIEYLMAKVVLPQRSIQRKLYRLKKNRFDNLNSGEPTEVKTENSNLLMLSTVPLHEVKIYLSPQKTIRFLLFVVFGLAIASLIGQFTLYFLPDYPLRDYFAELFDVGSEGNIPTLYSALALLFCAILLANIANVKKVAGDRYFHHWKALSIIFLYLSLDEVFSIHELLTSFLRSALNTSGFLYYAWVIPGIILVVICLLAFLQFLTHLPTKINRLFLVAGTLFVGGGIGMEIVNGYYENFYSDQNLTYAFLTTIEEFFEMLGVVVFIYALLSYMSSYMRVGLRVQISHNRKRQGTNC